MNISIIVPLLNEEKTIGQTLRALRSLAPYEIIAVDGDSTDASRTICAQPGVKLLSAERGRARQMNRGARAASGEVLLFLHADSKLPASALTDITAALSDSRYVGGRFDVRIEGAHWMLKIIGALINYRSRLTQVGTGDQALFVRREVFKRMGGFPDIPLMEDIEFCRALKRMGGIACLRSRVVTSGRRWERDGVWRTIFKMWLLKICYFAGVSPARLRQFYADTR
jgi:rSAM/selenodomain-associated transferase 2